MQTQTQRRPSDYRGDDIPSSLYDTEPPRLSDASMFDGSANPTGRGVFPWRTAFMAVVLFAIGITFLLAATLHFSTYDRDKEIAFIVLGSVSFIPGCYAVFNIVQWYRGVPGFHLSDCTSFFYRSFLKSILYFPPRFEFITLTGLCCIDAYHNLHLVAHWDDYRT